MYFKQLIQKNIFKKLIGKVYYKKINRNNSFKQRDKEKNLIQVYYKRMKFFFAKM